MKSVFIFEMIYCDDDELVYPLPLQRHILGYFSEFNKAEEFINADNDGCWFAKDMPFKVFEIKEFGLDKFKDEIQTFVFLGNGDLYGNYKSDYEKGFLGRNTEDCLFKIGDIVEFLNGNKLEIGIIYDLPPSKDIVIDVKAEILDVCGIEHNPFDSSDDSYIVLYNDGLSSHSHPIVQHVFKPSFVIDSEYRAMMRNSLNEKIKQRNQK